MWIFNTYIWIPLIIPAFIYGIISLTLYRKTFRKNNKVFTKRYIPGFDMAKSLLDKAAIRGVPVTVVSGQLTGGYTHGDTTLNLSETTFGSNSCGAYGVITHEVGHAIQDKKNSVIYAFRRILLPLTDFFVKLSLPLVIIGLIIEFLGITGHTIGSILILTGLISYSVFAVLDILTLPSEISASKQGFEYFESLEITDEIETSLVKKTAFTRAFRNGTNFFVSFLFFLTIFKAFFLKEKDY